MTKKTTHNETIIHKKSGLFKRFEKYLGEFVYGGIDGCVTTFAVVAGSVGAYLSTKSERDNYNKHKQEEYWEVDNLPEMEKEEIREIYAAKGFEGDLLEKVVEVITNDKELWVNTMMKEELEMIEEVRSPFWIGATTYISFITIGLIPLITYVIDYISPIDKNLFLITSVLTALGFVIIGWLKTYINQTSALKGIFETLALGGIAALVSYFVGDFLEQLIVG